LGADTSVDGWIRWIAVGVTPRRRSSQASAAHQRATTVTVAGRHGWSRDADVSAVDDTAPGGLTLSGSHDGHSSLDEIDRQAARCSNVGSSPASDDAILSSETAVSSRCHADVSGVAIGRDGGEVNDGDIIGIATALLVVRVDCERGESSECTSGASSHCTIS